MHPTEGLFDLATYEILTKREDDIRFMHSESLDLEGTKQLKRKLINFGYFKSYSDTKNCEVRLVSERLRKYVDSPVVR